MSVPAQPPGFREAPRGRLRLRFSRRQFLSFWSTEYRVQERQAHGSPALSLAELGNMPDEQLARLVPVIIPESGLVVRDGQVWASPPDGPPLALMPAESLALFAFNWFNGQTRLGWIALYVAHESGFSAEHSFAFVRGLFLQLVTAKLCIPKNDPDSQA